MVTKMRKNKAALRTLLILGITLITTLVLLVGTVTLHFPGFSLVSFAHAQDTGMMAAQTISLCASDPTDQHCTNQDPMVQGCYKDAQTIAFIEMYNPNAIHLAGVERRYSPTCHTEWGRIIKYGNGKQPIDISIANNTPRSSPGNVVYSTMIFVPILSIAPIIQGNISINGIDLNVAGGRGYGAILKPAQT